MSSRVAPGSCRVCVNKSPVLRAVARWMPGQDSPKGIRRTRRRRRPGAQIGGGIGRKRLSASRPVGRALWGSVPKNGCPRRRFLLGNGDGDGLGAKPSARQQHGPSFPSRSSMPQRLAWQAWKSGGLAASCYGSGAVMYRQAASRSTTSAQPQPGWPGRDVGELSRLLADRWLRGLYLTRASLGRLSCGCRTLGAKSEGL